jgi:hypothetical protein
MPCDRDDDERSLEGCRDDVALSYLPLPMVRGSPVPEVPKVPSPLMPWEPKSPGVEVGSERKRVFSDGRSLPDDDDPLTDDDPLIEDEPLAGMPVSEVDGTMLQGF